MYEVVKGKREQVRWPPDRWGVESPSETSYLLMSLFRVFLVLVLVVNAFGFWLFIPIHVPLAVIVQSLILFTRGFFRFEGSVEAYRIVFPNKWGSECGRFVVKPLVPRFKLKITAGYLPAKLSWKVLLGEDKPYPSRICLSPSWGISGASRLKQVKRRWERGIFNSIL